MTGKGKMQISNIEINLIQPKAGLIAFASLVLNDAVYVSGIAIHEKRDGNGYRLTYPTRKTGDQMFNIYHPIHKHASKALENAIFEKLKDVLDKGCKNVGYGRY